MNYKSLAKDIVCNIGGKENVKGVTHCVTRLRFTVLDHDKIAVDTIKQLPGVLSVVDSSGQFQVVLGPCVGEVFEEVQKLVGTEELQQVKKKEKKTIKGLAKEALDTLISCFVPAIPAIAGSGMIKVLVVLLSYAGLLETTSSTYTILNTIGDGVFYFLPFFVAYNAAKKMEVDIFLSMILAAILLHPNFSTLGESGTYVGFFGAGLKLINYSTQALPLIFGVWLLKYVDKFANKVSPNMVKVFLKPMISILIVAPILLILIGPAASLLGDGFAYFCNIMNQWGWLAVGLNAALFPIMVLTGTHNATIPLLVQMFATQGFDAIFLPSGMAANIAEAGAAGAVAFKTKNKGLRGTAISASFSALLGITEPALYGVNLRLKKPFIAVLLGSLLGGCYIGWVGLTAPTFVTPSILTAPIFVGAGVNFLIGLSSLPVVYFITFIITYFLGFEDLTNEDQVVYAPVEGSILPIEEVKDEAFASKSMGEGFAILPSEGTVVAPFDGEIVALFPTNHAIGIKRVDGLEALIHIGIDTVELQGEHFHASVQVGSRVKAGDTLIEFDRASLMEKGYDTTTMIVFTNGSKFKEMKSLASGTVKKKEKAYYVY